MKHLFDSITIRVFAVTVLLSCGSFAVSAQDFIVMKDGTSILTKVLEVSKTEIVYKKYSNLEGPVYRINKADVFSITYQNGETENLQQPPAIRSVKKTRSTESSANHQSTYVSANPVFSHSARENISRMYAAFTMAKLVFAGESADETAKGVTIGRLWGGTLTPKYPVFIEYGFTMTWLHSTEEKSGMGLLFVKGNDYHSTRAYRDDDYDYELPDYKFNYLNIAIPINLAYKLSFVGHPGFSIVPHAGLNFKANVLAKAEMYGEDWDCFDDEDMGDDWEWNRFQLGGQVGIGINCKKLYVGYQFQGDFMKLAEKQKMRTNMISIGYNF